MKRTVPLKPSKAESL